MVAFAGSLRLMEQFSPEQLMRLVGSGGDEPLAPIPDHLAHAEKVALRRARIDAIHRAQQQDSEPVRAPEAVTRGFDRPRSCGPAPARERDDDDTPATQTWVRDHLSRIYRVGPVWTTSQARAGHSRRLWRAAVGAMLRANRADVRSPEYVISTLVGQMAAGEAEDPRHSADYQAASDWPHALYEFAGVPVPQRRPR